MRIGIDVTPLPPNPVGAGNYIIRLVQSLAALQSAHEFVLFAQPIGRELIGDLPSQNIEWAWAPEHNPAARLVWEQIRLPGMVRRSGVELLHSMHYTRPYFLPCKSVVTFHDMTFFLFPELHTRSKRLFFPKAIRMSARRAEVLLTISESTRQDAIRILGIPEDKIFNVYPGISQDFHPILDPEPRLACRERYGLPEDFVLFVGLIEPRKNLPLLLRSYAHLLKRQIDIPLVLVGRLGWNYEEIYQLIRQLKLEKKVHFKGYVPSVDLPLIYNLARVFVYPSIYEGFGFPPLEAMACGTPVVTTSVSAMLECVGEAGLLVPAEDEIALADALQTLLDDPSHQERLSRAGQLRAAEFTWERAAKETLHIYEQTV